MLTYLSHHYAILFQALLREPIVTESPVLKKAVLLSTGVLVNKIKTMIKEMDVDTSIAVPELHKISQVRRYSTTNEHRDGN